MFGYRGRHAAPSQIGKVAGKATKAAPAVAIAGVMVGLPQLGGAASAATASVAATSAAAVSSVHTQATTNWGGVRTAAAQSSKKQASKQQAPTEQAPKVTLDAVTTADQTYEVQSGDTLSGIAQQFYGSYSDWQWLYQANTSTIADPNLIYPGQVLEVPNGASGSASQSSASDSWSGSSDTSDASTSTASVSTETSDTTSTPASNGGYSGDLSGTLGCSGLEQLWEDAGGSSSTAFVAAEIAMAESSGNQYAVSATDDIGYWQINQPTWGAEASFDPITNARAAISISDDGTDWSPWTTYNSGAYEGQC